MVEGNTCAGFCKKLKISKNIHNDENIWWRRWCRSVNIPLYNIISFWYLMAAVHPDAHRMTELDYNFPVLFGKTTHEYFGFTPFSQVSFTT